MLNFSISRDTLVLLLPAFFVFLFVLLFVVNIFCLRRLVAGLGFLKCRLRIVRLGLKYKH